MIETFLTLRYTNKVEAINDWVHCKVPFTEVEEAIIKDWIRTSKLYSTRAREVLYEAHDRNKDKV